MDETQEIDESHSSQKSSILTTRSEPEVSTLKGVPASSIKNSNPKEALPFLIPKPYTAKKIIIKKIPEKKLKEKGYPTVFMDSELLEEKKSKNMEELREIYNCCKELQSEPKLARTQPDRFNYCDN